jgi:hypothetical protein
MHIDDIRDMLEKLYPEGNFNLIFDNSCVREMLIRFDEGKPYFNINVKFYKVKFIYKGNSIYFNCFNETSMPFMEFRKQFMDVPCEISPEFLEKLKSAYDMKMLNRPNNGFDDQLQSLKNLSGLSEDEIKQKAGIPV